MSTDYEVSYTKGGDRLTDRVSTAAAALRHRTHLEYNGHRNVEVIRVMDLGTVDRDEHGRFVKVFTLSYEMKAHDGLTVRQVRHLPADGVERIGKVAYRKAGRDKSVWNIAVLDRAGDDVTCDFAFAQV